MTTITDQLAEALREIRDRNPASYGHNTEEMRADDWECASKALAAYDAQRTTGSGKPWRSVPAEIQQNRFIYDGSRYVGSMKSADADIVVSAVNSFRGF